MLVKKVFVPAEELLERGPGRPVIYPDGCRYDNEPSRAGGLCDYHRNWAARNDGEDPANAPARHPRVCKQCNKPVQLKRVVQRYGTPKKYKVIVLEHRYGTKGAICPGSGRAPRPRPRKCGKRNADQTMRCQRAAHGKPAGHKLSWHWSTVRYQPGKTISWRHSR